MLSPLEIDIEVLDVGMEIMKSDDCKEMLRNNRDTNNILAMI